MKICIAGKNNIASSILEYLLFEKKIKKEEIVVCCCKTDNGENTWQRSLRYTAIIYGIKEVSQSEVYNDPDLIFLSLEYDRIIKPSYFKSNKLFNIHFSLLPSYKGMYTSAWPILNNEKVVGVTFHYINSGIDTGAIVAQKKIILNFSDTSHDLYLKYIETGTQLVKECIDKFLPYHFICPSTQQPYDNSSYYSKNSIDYNNLTIDLNQTALSIYNQIRAFNFREYQIPIVHGQKIRFCSITNELSKQKAGTIIRQDLDSMLISTIDYDMILYIDKFDKIIQYCKTNNIVALKQICGLQNYVNEQEEHGWTPLIISTYNGYYDMAMHLIENGANIYAVNHNGTNLLMYAKNAFVTTGDSRLFEFFYKKGLSIRAKDYDGKSLLDYCLSEGLTQIGNISICTAK